MASAQPRAQYMARFVNSHHSEPTEICHEDTSENAENSRQKQHIVHLLFRLNAFEKGANRDFTIIRHRHRDRSKTARPVERCVFRHDVESLLLLVSRAALELMIMDGSTARKNAGVRDSLLP